MQQVSTIAQFLRRHPEIRIISLLLAGLSLVLSAAWEGGWIAKPSWANSTALFVIGQVLLVATIFLPGGTLSATPSADASKSSRHQYSQARLLGITIAAILTVSLALVALVADLFLRPPIFLFGLVAAVGILGTYLLVRGKMSPLYIAGAVGLGAVSILPLWGIPANYYESNGQLNYVKLCIGLAILTLAIGDLVTLRSKPREA